MTAWLDRFCDYERQGFREVPGPDSNPKILHWMQNPGRGKWVKTDATPWCGGAMSGILDECGLGHVIPDQPLAAISWLNCGEACEPKVGAIAVFPRDGGNHVTVIKRIDGDTWYCIGGNQKDSICTLPYDGRTARGTRWPIVTKTPREMTSESRIAAAAARQKRDQLVAGGTGGSIPATSSPVSAPPPPPVVETVPGPLPKGVKDSVTNIVGDISWFKQMAGGVIDFASFVGSKWWFIAGGIALYFLARSLWDSHRISTWRTQDHNTGRSI